MRPLFLSLLVSSMVCTAAVALADDMSNMSAMPQHSMAPPTPSPELKALGTFFGSSSVTWNGKCPAGAMGADSKEMDTRGKASVHPVLDGFGYTWDIEDAMGSGKNAMTWKGHMVAGYDANAKMYRGYLVDNLGSTSLWTGTLDGNKLVFETPEAFMSMGEMRKERLTWTKNDDGTLAFVDEVQPAGADWKTFETAVFRSGKGTKSKTEHTMATESTTK